MMKYVEPKLFTKDEVARLIESDDLEELHVVPISVSLYSDDLPWAQDICIRFSSHSRGWVRGNAVLGFGHLARRFRHLDLARVLPIIKRSLCDADVSVCGQALSAADDLEHFLGLIIDRSIETVD